MKRFMTLEEFRARFRVVDPFEAAAQEPNKHYDPFIEKKGHKEKEPKRNYKERFFFSTQEGEEKEETYFYEF